MKYNTYTQICSDCKKEFTTYISESCNSCYFEKLEKEDLIPIKKQNNWTNRKQIAYSILLTLPIFYFLSVKFGFLIEVIAIMSMLYGQSFSIIIDWLMRKF